MSISFELDRADHPLWLHDYPPRSHLRSSTSFESAAGPCIRSRASDRSTRSTAGSTLQTFLAHTPLTRCLSKRKQPAPLTERSRSSLGRSRSTLHSNKWHSAVDLSASYTSLLPHPAVQLPFRRPAYKMSTPQMSVLAPNGVSLSLSGAHDTPSFSVEVPVSSAHISCQRPTRLRQPQG